MMAFGMKRQVWCSSFDRKVCSSTSSLRCQPDNGDERRRSGLAVFTASEPAKGARRTVRGRAEVHEVVVSSYSGIPTG